MKVKKIRKPIVLLLISLAVFVNLAMVMIVYRTGLSIDDSSAATDGKLVLLLDSPASVIGVPNGTTLTVALTAQNTQDAGVSEVIVSYDPAILDGKSINEQQNILALGKNIDNATGKIKVDIANAGPGNLPANSNLVIFEFTVKNSGVSSTILRIDTASTLGIPNKLTTGGYGTLTLNFSQQTSQDAVLDLTLLSPASVTGITNGTTIVLALVASNTQGASASEMVIDFNKNVLTGTEITEQSGILALAKNVDNTNGRMSVDIAKSGSGSFNENTPIVHFAFTVKDASVQSTQVTISQSSTFGVPNKIAANGYGDIMLSFGGTVVNKDGRLNLNLISPSSTVNIAQGDEIVVGLSAQNTTGASAAELSIDFDASVLEGKPPVVEKNGVLGINKVINNLTGKITADIAKIGDGDLPVNTTLVEFTFIVKNANASLTIVSIDTTSSMGIPNKMDTNGFGSLTLQMKSGTNPSPYPCSPLPEDNKVGTNFFTIQAENYNNGGLGVGYFDRSAGNQGFYCRTDDVDVRKIPGNGYAVGWFQNGEWLRYTINVPQTGNYSIKVTTAGLQNNAKLRIEVDGNLFKTVNMLNTGSYDTFQTFTTSGGNLQAGSRIIRFYVENEYFDLDQVTFELTSTTTTPPSNPPTNPPTQTNPQTNPPTNPPSFNPTNPPVGNNPPTTQTPPPTTTISDETIIIGGNGDTELEDPTLEDDFVYDPGTPFIPSSGTGGIDITIEDDSTGSSSDGTTIGSDAGNEATTGGAQQSGSGTTWVLYVVLIVAIAGTLGSVVWLIRSIVTQNAIIAE